MNNAFGSKSFPLAEDLHRVPHLNWTLQDVSSQFNWTNPQYIQALQVYCASGIFIGFVLFITFGLIQCCIGCRKCSKSRYNYSYRMKQFNPILTSILFLCTLAIMIICVGWLYYGVGKVQSDMNKIAVYMKNISGTVDEYNDLVDQIHNNVISLQNETVHLRGHEFIAREIARVCEEIENEKLPDLKTDLKQLTYYNRARELVTAAIILAVMLCCGTLLIGICYGRVFVLHCSLVILTLCIFLSATLGGVYLSAAVASSDICVEQDGFMDYLIQYESVAEDVIKQFLKCKANMDSGDSMAVAMLNKLVKFLETMYGADIEALSIISDTLSSISTATDKLQHLLACQQIMKDYDHILKTLCVSTLKSVCSVCLITCVVVFLIWIVINQLKPYADRVEEWMRVEDILDKNMTITPEQDEEQEHPLTDSNSYPPPYTPDSYTRNTSTTTQNVNIYTDENEPLLSGGGHSLYHSFLNSTSPYHRGGMAR